ncbi:MAG: iron-containing alcohol dehydrogenase [Kiritimatiellae bacterium]|nr:iron-containing alcohol dehydrogenase [Kiritimatiellia bacterium]
MSLSEFLKPYLKGPAVDRLPALPHEFLYGPDASMRLAESFRELTRMSSVLVFFDERTRTVAGETCIGAMKHSGWAVSECLVPDGDDGSFPVCDDLTMRRLQASLPAADAYLAVGSGVINDLVKWLAAEAGKPYAVFATAASMNGYAASNVAPTINSVKSLFRAKAPLVIGADPSVIAAAPIRLTTAGLGDVLAKPVSTSDWVMNHQIFGEPFSEEIVGIISHTEPAYMDCPEGVRTGDPVALRGLMDALVLSGCAMTLQGSSLPASGGEHLISHTLDMKAHVEARTHDLHGRQVGVATIFAAALYDRILNMEPPEFKNALHFDASYWGSIIDSVRKQHDLAVTRMDAAIDALRKPGAWDTLRSNLKSRLRSPSVIKHCLALAGGAHRLDDIGCTREAFGHAVRNAASIRERFTSIDLGVATGLLPAAIDEIVDEWLM